MSNRCFSPEDDRQIAAEYATGTSIMPLVAKWGGSQMSVTRAIIRGGGTIRRVGNPLGRPLPANRRYALNERYFLTLGSEQVTWAGFVAGDGTSDRHSLIVKLAWKDRAHLEQMRTALNSAALINRIMAPCTAPAAKDTTTLRPYAVIHFNSVALCSDLANVYGLGGNKALRLEPWRGPTELMPRWWQGLFDADGYIVAPRKRKKGTHYEVGQTGTAGICEGWRTFLAAHGIQSAPIRRNSKSETCWVARVTGLVRVQEVLRILYGGSTVWLPRKKMLAEQILSVGRTEAHNRFVYAHQP